jgi:hypothetical protein
MHVEDVTQTFNSLPKDDKIQVLWEAIDYMEQSNSRTKHQCIELAMSGMKAPEEPTLEERINKLREEGVVVKFSQHPTICAGVYPAGHQHEIILWIFDTDTEDDVTRRVQVLEEEMAKAKIVPFGKQLRIKMQGGNLHEQE